MIWHLYDYYLDADAGYFATKKACEPLHIQYSYDDRTIVVVNSTYRPVEGLQASVHVHGLKWNELFSTRLSVDAAADSSQRVISIPENLYTGPERIFFIDLALSDAAGNVVSRNFYWVPGTLTTFDWNKTDYTHTPALRHEDLTALARLPQAQVESSAEISGRKICLRLKNTSNVLAFQVRAAARTATSTPSRPTDRLRRASSPATPTPTTWARTGSPAGASWCGPRSPTRSRCAAPA